MAKYNYSPTLPKATKANTAGYHPTKTTIAIGTGKKDYQQCKTPLAGGGNKGKTKVSIENHPTDYPQLKTARMQK